MWTYVNFFEQKKSLVSLVFIFSTFVSRLGIKFLVVPNNIQKYALFQKTIKHTLAQLNNGAKK